MPFRPSNKGFTLVELMVALFLTAVATAGIYRSYVSISTAYDVEDQVTEMQQNLRIAIHRMNDEIMMAAYDPTKLAGAAIISASNDSIHFTLDSDGDQILAGDDEDVTYAFDTDNYELDRNGISLIEHVDALDFIYLDANDSPLARPVASTDDIRGVQVSLVVRTANEDYSYTNNAAYRNLQDEDHDGQLDVIFQAAGDHYRRRILTARVKCRNMGLQ